MEVEKLCRTCKYLSTRCGDEPCKSCKYKSNWVAASKSGKFKAGDVIVAKNDYMSVKAIYIYLGNNWALLVPNYVLVRSECDYTFSTFANKLISDEVALHIYNRDLEYASSEDITKHDDRAQRIYCPVTLGYWFSKLIKDKSENVYETFTFDSKTVYNHKPKGARYDKFPTFNHNFIKRVIFNDPATIIFWQDGTKTVVKTQDGEKYDKEKGFAMAISKKILGNERDYYNVFKRWMRKGEKR